MYTVDFDRGSELLDAHWSGLFCRREVVRYTAAVRRGFEEMAFGSEFSAFPRTTRIAAVTQRGRAAHKVLREMRQPYLAVAAAADAALDWLIAGRRSAQPALSSLPRFNTWAPSSCSTR